jgi:ATPase family associated with various cellular activities (AAA)
MAAMVFDEREKRWIELITRLPAAESALRQVVEFGTTSAPPVEIDVTEALRTSALALPGYSTVDGALIDEIKSKVKRITSYIEDRTAHRPLTFILTAEPGSGKSYFVKCLAKDCGTPLVTANVASLETMSELGYWIDAIRDHKTQDETPVLLIDEADSKPEGVSAFLPLLWDGLFSWQGRTLKIGRCVIVLIASNERLRRYIEDGTADAGLKTEFPKIEDLLSRINGGVMKLGSIDDRRLDKLCIALMSIRGRFTALKGVQLPFLKLLTNTRFLHSVRSMEALIEYFPAPGADNILRVTPDFENTLVDHFLKRENFRSNVFAFHLEHGERVNANQVWSEHRGSQTIVIY